jgi:hypothetical protein
MNNIKIYNTLKAFSCALGGKPENVEITERVGL